MSQVPPIAGGDAANLILELWRPLSAQEKYLVGLSAGRILALLIKNPNPSPDCVGIIVLAVSHFLICHMKVINPYHLN